MKNYRNNLWIHPLKYAGGIFLTCLRGWNIYPDAFAGMPLPIVINVTQN
jgi:hypothetical protein